MTAIPMQPDFPVKPEDHEDHIDENLFWRKENAHFPDPLKPLDFFLGARVIYDSMDITFEHYGIPFRQHLRKINSYLYLNVEYISETGEAGELEAQSEQYLKTLNAVVENINDKWNDEWLPEIKENLDFWENYDLKGASGESLLKHLYETEKRQRRCWEIHFLLYHPMVLATNLFEETYMDLFEGSRSFDAHLLLSGFENLTVKSNAALWELSHKALNSPAVCKIFTSNPPEQVMNKLPDCEEGKVFLNDFNVYLDTYGKRGDKLYLSDPFPIENPAAVIKEVQRCIHQPGRDIEKELKKLVAQREKRLAEVHKQLADYPKPVTEMFEALLKTAQDCAVIREDHNHWIDYQVTYYVRRVILEMGNRLVNAGATEKPEHVFYLTPDELKETAKTLPEAEDRRGLIEKRFAVEEKFVKITPPPAIGTLPPPSFKIPDDPMFRAFFKIDGLPVAPSEDQNELKGHGGSSGIFRGTAKLILSLSQAEKLCPGDIMVAKATMPAWTPFFSVVSAIVTDSGGILSHSAIIAREYGIPAVVGACNATTVIQEGQTIEVDGDAGIVRIISQP